jgi:hypothetical protein
MKNLLLIFLLLLSASFYSCSSDDVKSSENYITEFIVKGIGYVDISIKNDIKEIYIYTYPDNYSKLLTANREIKYSNGAKLDSTGGDDWTAKDFRYVVIAENGEEREYSINIDVTVPRLYSFDKWIYSKGGNQGYYIPSGLNSRWTSGNEGISSALALLGRNSNDPKSYPTRDSVVDGKNAVLMETIQGGVITFMNKDIPLFSGNLIFGNFNFQKALLGDELSATELGHIYPARPKVVKGYYKYKEGPGDFKDSSQTIFSKPDSCNMSVRFYRSDLQSGGDTTLTVGNIKESDLVIAEAYKEDCETDGDDFKLFELTLEYKSLPDFTNHRYKLAISFAASRDGDVYAGKIGTKLIVAEIEFEDYED